MPSLSTKNKFCSQKNHISPQKSVHISKFESQPKNSFRAQKFDTGRTAQKSLLSQKVKKNYNSVPNPRFSAQNPVLRPKIDSDPKIDSEPKTSILSQKRALKLILPLKIKNSNGT